MRKLAIDAAEKLSHIFHPGHVSSVSEHPAEGLHGGDGAGSRVRSAAADSDGGAFAQ